MLLVVGCDRQPVADLRAKEAVVLADIERRARGVESPSGAGPEAAARMRSVADSIKRLGLEPWRDRIALSFFAANTNDMTPAGMSEYVGHFFVGDRCTPTKAEFLSAVGSVIVTANLPHLKRFTIQEGFDSVPFVCYVNWDGKSTERLEGAWIVSLPRLEGITVRLAGEGCASEPVPVALENR